MKKVLKAFPQRMYIRHTAISKTYRELYAVPYTVQERRLFFGVASFYDVILLLKQHGVGVPFSYTNKN